MDLTDVVAVEEQACVVGELVILAANVSIFGGMPYVQMLQIGHRRTVIGAKNGMINNLPSQDEYTSNQLKYHLYRVFTER